MEIFFEENEEESLDKAVHDAADEHHDQEEEDLHVSQDGLEAAHRVLWLGKLEVHVNL